MFLSKISLLYILLLATATSKLIHLNDDNYEQALKEHGPFMVINFVTSYCESCQEHKKFWRNVAENYEGVTIAEVNILDNSEKLTADFNVCEWPVQKIVNENKEILTVIKKMPKNVAMAANVIKKAISEMHEATCQEIHEDHAGVYSHVAVYFAPPETQGASMKEIVPQYFIDAYKDERSFMRKFMLIWTRDISCAPDGLKQEGGVALYMKFHDEPYLFLNKDSETKKFDQWMSQKGVDRVGKFDHVAMNLIFKSGKKGLIMFADPKADYYADLEHAYNKAGIAMKRQGQLFYMTDAEDEVLNKFCFVDKNDLPQMVLISPKEESVFKYDNPMLQKEPKKFNPSEVAKFLSDHEAGKLTKINVQ